MQDEFGIAILSPLIYEPKIWNAHVNFTTSGDLHDWGSLEDEVFVTTIIIIMIND